MANMFIVSCRKDFWSTTDFSGGLDIRDLDMTGDGSGASVTSANFLQAIAGKRVMVLVHGYNNDRLDVLDSYGTIDRQMRLLNFLGGAAAPYDAVVGFAWPGGSVARVVSVRARPRRRFRAAPRAPARRSARRERDRRSQHAQPRRARRVRSAARRAREHGAHRVELRLGRRQRIGRGRRALLHRVAGLLDVLRLPLEERSRPPRLVSHRRLPRLRHGARLLGPRGSRDRSWIARGTSASSTARTSSRRTAATGRRGEVWSFMAQELATPTTAQFVTLTKTTETLRAVFRVTGGTESMRIAAAAGESGARRASSAETRRAGAREAGAARAGAAPPLPDRRALRPPRAADRANGPD